MSRDNQAFQSKFLDHFLTRGPISQFFPEKFEIREIQHATVTRVIFLFAPTKLINTRGRKFNARPLEFITEGQYGAGRESLARCGIMRAIYRAPMRRNNAKSRTVSKLDGLCIFPQT